MGVTHRRNLFIVGAGASAEFGLPTGKALLRKISQLAKRQHGSSHQAPLLEIHDEVKEAICALASDQAGSQGVIKADLNNLYEDAVWIARNVSLAPSIDNLLHTHKNNSNLVAIGKILISKALVDAEKASSLYVEPRDKNVFQFFSKQKPNPENLAEKISATESWLAVFFWLLVELRDFDSFLEALAHITFISFNYDRCIEQFLTSAAWSYFRLDEHKANKVLTNINIVRPYGGLGSLRVENGRLLGFGDYNPTLIKTSSGIRTFTEGVSDASIANNIIKAFNSAEVTFFMGFGFLDLNLKLLLGENFFDVKRVIGTRKGLSDESAAIVYEQLQEKLFFGNDPVELRQLKLPVGADRLELSDLKCRELMNKHQFFLRKQRN